MDSVFDKGEVVLVLPSWYPSRVDAFNGDFVQRHVKAISGYQRQHVIYVVKDVKGTITKNILEEEKGYPGYTEQVIYYRSAKTGIGLLDRFLSQRRSRQLYRSAIDGYVKKQGVPALVHVHVAIKAGMIALWLKKKWNIPFILSEHWTAYLPESDEPIPVAYRLWVRKVIKAAAAVTTVSAHLGKAMQLVVPELVYRVIPNVVDTTLFYPQPRQRNELTRFLHVSNMNYQKNTEAIIKALQVLKEKGAAFEMELFGPVHPELENLVKVSGLEEYVFFEGEVPQAELAQAMREADALVLYSRFETFGCVIIEANACAVPVIVSDLAVFHELVKDNVNGIFVKGDDPVSLASTLAAFTVQQYVFDNIQMAAHAAALYSYPVIGQRFAALYHLVTDK